MEYKRQFIYQDIDALWEVMLNMHLALKRISLQPQPITVLLYFCRYGLTESTVRKLLFDKKVPSRQTIHNAKTTLKKVGLLIKKQNGRKCDWGLAAPLDSIEMGDNLDFLVRCKIQL